MYARIVDGKATDVVRATDNADIARFFHPDYILNHGGLSAWVEVPLGTRNSAVDNGDGTFTNPESTESAPFKSWGAYEFVSRFTPSERTAIRNAAKVVEALDDFMFMLDMAAKSQTRVVASDPLLVTGMEALVTGGLLTDERKTEIMS